ncbi:MAG: NAD(P)/FAD-dependent oxidoreductase [Desulfomonilaceae bacterium]
MTIFDLVIVGGGPAGLAAGLQASHMGLKIKIMEKHRWGGRLGLARKVENVPGLTRPYSGTQVVRRLMVQVHNAGLPTEFETCELIDHPTANFVLKGSLNTYESRTVIVATGVCPKQLAIQGIDPHDNNLFYSWRDLPRKKGVRVAIVGSGEAAFDQACTLAEKSASVVVLIRSHKPRAFEILVQEAKNLGVDLILNATIERVETKDQEMLIHLSDGRNTTLSVDYILVAIGTTPSEITISDSASAEVNRGLFWAGDVCSGSYRQVAIAFGDGVRKAMIVYDYVKGH